MHEQAARGRVGDGRCLGQDPLHPLVRRERLALDDADRRDRPHELRVQRAGGLLLHDRVEPLEVAEVAGRDGVHQGALVDHRLGRRRDGTEPRLATEERGEGRADPAGLVRVDLEGRAQQLRPPASGRRPRKKRRPNSSRCGVFEKAGEEPALREWPVVALRHDQVPAAEAPVAARRADIGHPAAPVVVDRAQEPGRRLDHHGAVAEVQKAAAVDGVRVGRQVQRPRVDQLRVDEHVVVSRHRPAGSPCARPCVFTPWIGVHEGVEGACEVQVVVDLVQRVRGSACRRGTRACRSASPSSRAS